MSSEDSGEQSTYPCSMGNSLSDFNISDSPAIANDVDIPQYDVINLQKADKSEMTDIDEERIIEMDFRRYGDDALGETYATHQIQKHPAVFIPHIPRHIINTFSTTFNQSDDKTLILDPYNGSGTTGLEAKLLGRDYLGIEINPLSKIISDVKVTPIPPTLARRGKHHLLDILYRGTERYHAEYDVDFPDGTEKNRWFERDAIAGLTRIRKAVHVFMKDQFEVFPLGLDQEKMAIDNLNIQEEELRNRLNLWFTLMIANTVFDVSNADPNVSKAHKSSKMRKLIRTGNHPPDPIAVFQQHLDASLSQLIDLWNHIYRTNIPGGANQKALSVCQGGNGPKLKNNHRHNAKIDIRLDDAREFSYDDYLGRVDLAITSPPYINAMNYYRGTKLRLFWIMDLLDETFDIEQMRRSIVGTNYVITKDVEGELPKTIFESWDGPTSDYRKTNLPKLDETILDIHSGGLSEAKSRAYITWKFFAEDILHSLIRCYEHMKPGAHFFFLIGENTIGGNRISSHRFVADVAQNLGMFDGVGRLDRSDSFDVLGFGWDEISNRDLFQGRNHTSGVIEGEYVVVLQKPI